MYMQKKYEIQLKSTDTVPYSAAELQCSWLAAAWKAAGTEKAALSVGSYETTEGIVLTFDGAPDWNVELTDGEDPQLWLNAPEQADFLWTVWLRAHRLPLPILRTQRLCLRELMAEDLNLLRDRGLTGALAHTEPESYIRYMYELQMFGMWLVLDRMTGEYLGIAGLQMTEESTYAELGYEILPPHRQKGYAEEACRAILAYAKDELYMERIDIRIASDNIASCQLAAKLGFVLDALPEQNGTESREICGTYCFFT